MPIPNPISPTTIRANVPAAWPNENTPVLTAAIAKRYRIRAVASLARPSPSSTTDPPREPQAACDGKWGNHVGGRHNGPEHKADCERHAEQPVDGEGHRAGREDHTAEGKKRDRAQVEPELAPAYGDPGRVDERRQD